MKFNVDKVKEYVEKNQEGDLDVIDFLSHAVLEAVEGDEYSTANADDAIALLMERKNMRIVIDVSERFEPGAESIGEFVDQAATSLKRIAAALQADPSKNLEDVVGKEELDPQKLITLEGEY